MKDSWNWVLLSMESIRWNVLDAYRTTIGKELFLFMVSERASIILGTEEILLLRHATVSTCCKFRVIRFIALSDSVMKLCILDLI